MDKNKDKPFGDVVPDPTTEPVIVTKSHRFASIHTFLRQFLKKPTKKHVIAVSGISLAVLAIGLGVLRLFGPKPAKPNPVPEITSNYVPPVAEPVKFYSPLTGLETTEELSKRAVTGIMIENSVDARPQSGLVDAGVVFEAIAEGGITRFLALFQEAQPDYIGPIRSARPYYVRWVSGFDAGYVHSGGSGEALSLIGALGVKDMDHGKYGSRFFDRVSSRYAPHNVYTSMARLDQLRAENGFNESKFTAFERLNDTNKAEATGTPATSISFDISSALYDTSYRYDADAKVYKRNLAGAAHNDERTGKQISPKVVVALYVPYSIHPDGVHSVYQNVGTGKAQFFQDGVMTEGSWEKPSDTASLVFKTASGTPMPLEPGQVWITAIQEGRVTYTP